MLTVFNTYLLSTFLLIFTLLVYRYWILKPRVI